MFGTHCRLGVSGHPSWRSVVRAAAQKLRPYARTDPEQRQARKLFYREMLRHHANAQRQFDVWRF